MISLTGAIVPALVALVAIPGLLHALGAERFGLLSFVWIIFGTFAVLDFGTGRATTKYIAELIAGERAESIPSLFWTASAINLAVGLLCGVVLFVGAPWLSAHVVKVPGDLRATAILALRITAVALPWIILGGVFRSALEGLQRFDLSNAVQLPVSALNYLAPLLVARAGGSMPWVIASVCASRICAMPPLLLLCRHQLPLLGRPHVERRQLGPLLRFGSWLTVSNVVGPVILSMDRLFVGSVLGVSALGLYAPVYELVTRLSLVPASMMAALFPAFSTLTNGEPWRIRAAMRRAQRVIALIMLPIALVGVTFAPTILRLWLGVAQNGSSVAAMQLLLVGLLFLSIGAVPFTLVQALGKPKWSAMVHVGELPVHAAITWFAVSTFGIVGAAGAWSLRAIYDAALFDSAVRRMIGRGEGARLGRSARATVVIGAAAGILSAFALWYGARSPMFMGLGAVAVLVYAAAVWQWALEGTERQAVLSVIQRGALRRQPGTDVARDRASTL
jgi:O-antigen/teichoic acid export membrane protein